MLNPGMAFSLLSGKQLFLIIATSIALILSLIHIYEVKKVLEQARAEKVIGASLEAAVTLYCNDTCLLYTSRCV